MEEKEKKMQECYILGKPIRITEIAFGLTNETLIHEYREQFTTKEIVKACPTTGPIKLFLTEDAALEYARFLRTGSTPGPFWQSAIYTVEASSTKISETKSIEEIITITPMAGHTYPERSSKISYYLIDMSNIKVLNGKMKFQLDSPNHNSESNVLDFSTLPKPSWCATFFEPAVSFVDKWMEIHPNRVLFTTIVVVSVAITALMAVVLNNEKSNKGM